MYQIYQVGPNESINSIANKLNIAVDELKRINGLSNNTNLMTGSYLIIPSKGVKKDYNTYIVKPGDNMYMIAKENGIDLDTLISINGLNKDDYIYPNQEIIIPSNRTYITKENDKIKDIITKTNIDMDKLGNLYLMQDQIIKY